MKRKVIEYTNEREDDFAGTHIKRKPLGKNFKYVHDNIVWRVCAFLLYYAVAIPVFTLIDFIVYRHRYVNKRALKKQKNGYYIYANHTSVLCDAFAPALSNKRKRAYLVSNQDAFSLFGVKTIVQMLGAIPLPSKTEEYRKYLTCLKRRARQAVCVYPEAHIWPYYTKIREYSPSSFKYPVVLKKPMFVFTTCYQRKKIGNRPKAITFIDGPFYATEEGNVSAEAERLRNISLSVMRRRTEKYSTYEYIEYRKKSSESVVK